MNKERSTPLHLAAKLGHLQCVQYLLEAGCQLDILNCLDQSALYLAIEHGNNECAEILLENYYNTNLASIRGYTARRFMKNCSSIAARCTISTKMHNRLTPLNIW